MAITLLSVTTALSGCVGGAGDTMTPMTSSPSTTSPASASTRSYGSDPAQVYDVIPPASGSPAARGTVVVVHGGFWRAQYDREHALPGTRADVRDLVASIASQPDLPKPLGLVGHSAGGHLVTWAAGQPWASERGIAGVVSLAGVVDLGAADRLHLGDDATR